MKLFEGFTFIIRQKDGTEVKKYMAKPFYTCKDLCRAVIIATSRRREWRTIGTPMADYEAFPMLFSEALTARLYNALFQRNIQE